MGETYETIGAIRAALDAGVAAEEVTRACLGRIEAQDGQLKSFVTVAPERALEDARHLDRLSALGVPRGPLAGVPVGVKDIIDVAGLPTGGGSLTRSGVAPAIADAPVVARLRAAGAVIVGKTATVEYAFGGWGTNVTLGTPLNPWDRAHPRTPGGSSNGSGVAVAAGLVPVALGSDTGGSVRLPASFCGVVGLKTTARLVSTAGVLPLSPDLDTIGPLAGSVADAAAIFSVMADAPADRAGRWRRELESLAAGEVPPIKGVRVGILVDHGVGLHPATAAGFEAAVRRLADLGAELREVRLPDRALWTERCGLLMSADAYRHHGRFAEEDPSRLGAPVRGRIRGGRDVGAAALLDALEARRADKENAAALFETIDVLLTPTTAKPAVLLASTDEDEGPGVFTRLANWLELAAVSVPVMLSDEGLPVCAQLVVPGLEEPRALRVAAAMEAHRGGPLRLG